MKRLVAVLLVGLVAAVSFIGCEKKTETLETPELKTYAPFAVGKHFIYRLDSTRPGQFGSTLVTRSYQAKDSIESTFIDNQGRTSYRIFRFIRDTAGTQSWRFAATYVATPTSQKLEFVDNNLRFIKLHAPIRTGFTWKGNSFINTSDRAYRFLADWEYEYQNVGEPYTVFQRTFPKTVTVFQHDETSPSGPFNPNLPYQEHSHGVEVYAEGVGLIYKEFLHWTWQQFPQPGFEDETYGVRLRLISHN